MNFHKIALIIPKNNLCNFFIISLTVIATLPPTDFVALYTITIGNIYFGDITQPNNALGKFNI